MLMIPKRWSESGSQTQWKGQKAAEVETVKDSKVDDKEEEDRGDCERGEEREVARIYF